MSDDSIRLHVVFSGTVQGVGFRYTARSISRRYHVTGFVRNLPDGRVELVAEGQRKEVLNFIAGIERQMEEYISSAEKTLSKAQNEYASFIITF